MLRDRKLFQSFRGELRDETGSALIETALSLVVTFLLAFGLFELCMFSYTCIVLNDSAQEGVRYAIMHGTNSSNCSGPDSGCTDQTYDNVKAVVRTAASASLHDISAMTVNVIYGDATAAPGHPVSVSVIYTYVPYVNFPGLEQTVTFTSQGRTIF